MDGVTGPPPEMAESRGDLTPMMTQYFELTEAYDDALVLFQVGDFYEAFCDAAEELSRVCETTLTKREDSTGTYRMAGIPIDNAASYVDRLLGAGYRVAVADQVEDPEEASGVVERAVTRVVTPGTVTDDELLDTGATYVACVAAAGDQGNDDVPPYAVAFVDISTGEFRVAGVDRDGLREELERFDPAEVVCGPAIDLDLTVTSVDPELTTHDADAFAPDRAARAVDRHVGDPDALLDSTAELRAAGGLLAYAEYTQGGADGELGHVSRLRRYDPEEYVRLDATAVRSLEVFESRSHGDGPTLLSVVDETVTAPGRRCLTGWLRQPLLDRDAIETRHDAVEALVDNFLARDAVRSALSAVYDLERLVTRVSRGRADARDLRSLHASVDAVPELRAALEDPADDCAALAALRDRLDPCESVRDLVDRAIIDDPPREITDGGVVREGYDEQLDDLRATEREGREWVTDLEERERKRTGIDSLSVGYNEVHGYYIEVTDPNLDRVPDDYTRRQTLKNAERFYTPDLKRREDEILGAAERADAREHRLFRDVRDRVAEAADRVRTLADALAELDALAGLAETAVSRAYVRPEMGTPGVSVTAGRHPVVESTATDEFVPNDVDLVDRPLAVVTGPNMSGKSTYMRQVALIAVLAQAGSFVPADTASLPVFDGVFTRVGASDDIAGGQSTFMREMTELTDILHDATPDSLVLLDEVGRGTSTVDGLSIAWAVTEFVHDEVGATTLFATHYHELTEAAADLPGACNLHFEAERTDDSVTFRYDVREGPASSSYGVEIARMAGVPGTVVERSRGFVERGGPTRTDDTGDGDGDRDRNRDRDRETPDANGDDHDPGTEVDGWGDLRPEAAGNGNTNDGDDGDGEGTTANGKTDAEAVLAELRSIDLARMTPLDALNRLADLRDRVDPDP